MRTKLINAALAVAVAFLMPAAAANAAYKTNFVSKKVARKNAAAKPGGSFRISSLFSGHAARSGGEIYSGGRYLGKTIVPFKRKLKPGTILIKTNEKALYYVLPGHKALKYGIGVGREGFTWRGRHHIAMKKKWPEWRPPEVMKRRVKAKYNQDLPDVMEGGPKNPLGARAMYISGTLYRIHGTNRPSSIGKNVSSGCIRMLNSEVSELYEKVRVGAKVIVE